MWNSVNSQPRSQHFFLQDLKLLLATQSHRPQTSVLGKPAHLPPHVMELLQTYFGVYIERFSSPLAFHPCNHVLYSTGPVDHLFGSSGNPFSVPWYDSSCVTPVLTGPDINKALKFAIF